MSTPINFGFNKIQEIFKVKQENTRYDRSPGVPFGGITLDSGDVDSRRLYSIELGNNIMVVQGQYGMQSSFTSQNLSPSIWMPGTEMLMNRTSTSNWGHTITNNHPYLDKPIVQTIPCGCGGSVTTDNLIPPNTQWIFDDPTRGYDVPGNWPWPSE